MTLTRPTRTRFNDHWHFQLDGSPAAPVTLPHSWNALDALTPDPDCRYWRGLGVYTRIFSPPPLPPGDRLWLEVEAAAMKARAYLNEAFIGEHTGGYTAFTLELTSPAEVLSLVLEVDNTPDANRIPSDRSDFFHYGGLTRNLWLYTTGPARIDTLGFCLYRTNRQAIDGIGSRGSLWDGVKPAGT